MVIYFIKNNLIKIRINIVLGVMVVIKFFFVLLVNLVIMEIEMFLLLILILKVVLKILFVKRLNKFLLKNQKLEISHHVITAKILQLYLLFYLTFLNLNLVMKITLGFTNLFQLVLLKIFFALKDLFILIKIV